MLTKWRSSIDLLPPKLYKQTCPPNIYLVCDDVCECYSLSARFAQVVERLTSDPKVPGSTPGSVKLRQKVLNILFMSHLVLLLLTTFNIVYNKQP